MGCVPHCSANQFVNSDANVASVLTINENLSRHVTETFTGVVLSCGNFAANVSPVMPMKMAMIDLVGDVHVHADMDAFMNQSGITLAATSVKPQPITGGTGTIIGTSHAVCNTFSLHWLVFYAELSYLYP